MVALAKDGFVAHGIESAVGSVAMAPGLASSDAAALAASTASVAALPRHTTHSRASFSIQALDSDAFAPPAPAHADMVLCLGIGEFSSDAAAATRLVQLLVSSASTGVVVFSAGTQGEGKTVHGYTRPYEQPAEVWVQLYVAVL